MRNKSIKSFFRVEKSALIKVLLKRTSWRLSAFFWIKSKKCSSTMYNFWKLSECFVIRSRRSISVLLFFNILLTIRAPYKEQSCQYQKLLLTKSHCAKQVVKQETVKLYSYWRLRFSFIYWRIVFNKLSSRAKFSSLRDSGKNTT